MVQGGQRGSLSPKLPEVMTLASIFYHTNEYTVLVSMELHACWTGVFVSDAEALSQFLWGGNPPPVVSKGSSVSCALSWLLLHQDLPGSNPHNSGLLWDLVPSVFPAPVGSLLSTR